MILVVDTATGSTDKGKQQTKCTAQHNTNDDIRSRDGWNRWKCCSSYLHAFIYSFIHLPVHFIHLIEIVSTLISIGLRRIILFYETSLENIKPCGFHTCSTFSQLNLKFIQRSSLVRRTKHQKIATRGILINSQFCYPNEKILYFFLQPSNVIARDLCSRVTEAYDGRPA